MTTKLLIVQIPAYNEEQMIAKVIKEIPRKIEGIKEVKVLVVDDGSTDKTAEVAKSAGADYVIRNTKNLGLAYTFQKAINKSLELGADIIVNTDADFQYNQTEIPKLIKPILEEKADIVSGDRQIKNLDHMVLAKKYGNIWGSKFVRLCADNNVEDASSGFRAFTKEAALRLFIISNHTYTHQTLIQATHKNLAVCEVPVEFRKRENGHSKLIGNVPQHIKKSMTTILRTTLMYNSLKVFSYIGGLIILIGLIPIGRWYWLSYWAGQGGQHIQSIIAGSILINLGVFSILLGVISDLIALNRRYLEEILYLNRKREYDKER